MLRYNTKAFGLKFSLFKKLSFCSRGVTDNTMVFGTIDSGSIPDGSATNLIF